MAANVEDRRFESVFPGSLQPYSCSPELPDDPEFRGVILAAPRVSPLARDPDTGAFARVIVCGAYQLDADYLGLRERFLGRLLVVAVDVRTHRPFAGVVRVPGGDIDPDPFAGRGLLPSDFAGRSVGGYFNLNLASRLRLPEGEADYHVYATVGEFVSNVVRIEVRRERP
jgi:hypothetical protein